MYTFVTSKNIFTSEFIQLEDDHLTIIHVQGRKFRIEGSKKEVERLYQIIVNEITKGRNVINLVNIKEQFCFLDLKGI